MQGITNIKLKTYKLMISKEVEFGGSVVSAEMVPGKKIVNTDE